VERRSELFVVRAFLIRERAFIRFVRELVDASLHLCVGTQCDNPVSGVGREAFGKGVQDPFEKLCCTHTVIIGENASPRNVESVFLLNAVNQQPNVLDG
jgi:hypothetical protein